MSEIVKNNNRNMSENDQYHKNEDIDVECPYSIKLVSTIGCVSVLK